jgi:hypothetical protein
VSADAQLVLDKPELVDDGELIAHVELVDRAETAAAGVGETAMSVGADSVVGGRHLAGEADRIAARASTPGTRRQYASIYRSFTVWLAAALGRAPRVQDLDADVIAAYARHLAAAGGRGGRPAAPATVRVYVSMVRALAGELGLEPNGRRGARPAPSPRAARNTDRRRLQQPAARP